MKIFSSLFARTMRWSRHPHAPWYLALLSFAESSFFPVPPDVMLAPMAMAAPRRAWALALLTTVASVLGGLFGYAIGYFAYETIGVSLLKALGLWDTFPAAACYLREFGAEIILIKGATPIPFKLLTLTAGFIQMPLFDFIWSSVLSRAFQFMLVGILFWKFGAPIKAFIDKYLAWVSAGFIVIVVGGFVAFTMLAGGGQKPGDKCSGVTTMEQVFQRT